MNVRMFWRVTHWQYSKDISGSKIKSDIAERAHRW